MRFFRAVANAIKQVKQAEAEHRAAITLHDDPLSVELIRKIAREYQYHFEIVQKDGTILRFFKEGVEGSKDPTAGAYW